jgi:hypothetical protein
VNRRLAVAALLSGVGLAAALLALVSPGTSGPVLRIALVLVGALLAADRLMTLLHALPTAHRSAFDAERAESVPPELPADLAWLHSLLDDSMGARSTVHPGVVERMRTIAARRLAHVHHLHLDLPSDHAAIRAVVTPALWQVIGPSAPVAEGERADRASRAPSHSLPSLLDELERL